MHIYIYVYIYIYIYHWSNCHGKPPNDRRVDSFRDAFIPIPKPWAWPKNHISAPHLAAVQAVWVWWKPLAVLKNG